MNVSDSNINNILQKINNYILLLEKNINKLNYDEITLLKKQKLNYNILSKLNHNKFNIFLNYSLLNKRKFVITKHTIITDFTDLYIIDNLHDLFSNRSKNTNIKKNMAEKMCKIIANKLTESFKNIIIDKNKFIKNVNNSVKELIINKFGLPNIVKANILLTPFTVLKNDIYFETKGLFQAKNMICPFKQAIDSLTCKNDTNDIRKELNLNTSFIIKNYDSNIITIILENDKIKITINNNNIFYEKFFKKIDANNKYTVIYNNDNYIINNNIGGIVDIISKITTDVDKYIDAGLHLKRMGDYAQCGIFILSNITYFQTFDEYCFLFACLKVQPNKILILNNKTIYTKVKYNDILYNVYINDYTSIIIDNIIKELSSIITLYKIGGNNGTMIIKKIEDINYNNNYQKYKEMIRIKRSDSIKTIPDEKKHEYFDEYFQTTISEHIEKIDDEYLYSKLNDAIDINNNAFGILDLLFFKQNIDGYKKLLGNIFPLVNDMIDFLMIYLDEINPINYDTIYKLYNKLFLMKKYIGEFHLDIKYINFIETLEKIYNSTDIEIFNKECYIFCDLIFNYEKYDIKINESIDKIIEYIRNRYDELYENNDIDIDNTYIENTTIMYNKYIKYKLKYLLLKKKLNT